MNHKLAIHFFSSWAILSILWSSPTSAAELEFEGTVTGAVKSYTSNQTEDNDVEIDGTGLAKDTNRTLIEFSDATLEFNANDSVEPGWDVFAQINVTLQEDENDKTEIVLDEASANVERFDFRVSLGILEDDLGDFQGVVDQFSIGGIETTTLEEDSAPGLRLGYIGIEELRADATVRQFHEPGDLETPRANHMQFRVDVEYEPEWGLIQGVYDIRSAQVEDAKQFRVVPTNEMSSPIDSGMDTDSEVTTDDEMAEDSDTEEGADMANETEASASNVSEDEADEEDELPQDAGRYRDNAQLMYIAFQVYLLDEKLNPFLTYGQFEREEREAVQRARSVRSTETAWVLGLDWVITEESTVTMAVNQQQREKNKSARKDEGERNRVERLTGYGIAANYELGPLELSLGYTSVANNRSDLVKSEKDLYYRSLEFEMDYSF